jgi:hypothetical protein
MFCRVLCSILILYYFGGVEGLVAAEAQHPFSALKADVDIDIEDGEFEVLITFTLGEGSNGIDPATDSVILQFAGGTGSYSLTIPAGSFKKDRSGRFTFQGTVNRVRLQASIRPVRGSSFEFESEGDRANMRGFANPVTVSLTIGDDGASGVFKAKIE